MTLLIPLFRRAKPDEWITDNPAESIKVRVNRRDVTVLTVPKVQRLLTVASSSSSASSVTPFFALQLFGGLRSFEAAQIHWSAIHFETGQLEVRAATSKRRESRFVPLEPVLTEILMKYRRPHGLVVSGHSQSDVRAVKIAAGLGDWPVDVLRHSYGSNWLAVHQNRAMLAENMGNSADVIRQHYRKALPPDVAREYWSIESYALTPSSVIPMAAGT
jgi:integrase